MAELESFGIIIPLITSIVIPFVIIGVSRFLKGSDNLTRSAVVAEQRLREIEEDIDRIQDTRKEIWDRLGALEKSVYNICWRIAKIEGNHEGTGRLE